MSTIELESAGWEQLDPIFTHSRRRLAQLPRWRYGSQRVQETAKRAFDVFESYGGIEGRTYCDLGCGVHHPFGVSSVMYINGADSTVALDHATIEPTRTAEALYDLLAECLIDPDAWHWSRTRRQDFLQRIRRFDLRALRAGDLRCGIQRVPIDLVRSDVADCTLDRSIDLMASDATLEHFLDFGSAIRRIRAMMTPGGIGYHHIDLTDHRSHVEPDRYHWWSFLAEGEDWSDGLCNRLRYAEIRSELEEAGFEILLYTGRRQPMPAAFQPKGRFGKMPEDELEMFSVKCVLRNPG